VAAIVRVPDYAFLILTRSGEEKRRLVISARERKRIGVSRRALKNVVLIVIACDGISGGVDRRAIYFDAPLDVIGLNRASERCAQCTRPPALRKDLHDSIIGSGSVQGGGCRALNDLDSVDFIRVDVRNAIRRITTEIDQLVRAVVDD